MPQLLANPDFPGFLLGHSESARYGYIILGLLIAIFPLSQFVAAPILGQLSDMFGRKKILVFSLLGTGFSHVLFALGIQMGSVPVLFLARFLDGITGGNIAVAQASIADITLPETRTRNFGLIGAAFGLGFVVGPFLGGKFSDPAVVSWFNASTPFWFAALLSAANVILLWTRFDETHLTPNPDLKVNWIKSLHNLIRAFNLPGLRALYTSIFLFHCGFSFFTSFISVYLISRFGFSQGRLGNFFAYVGCWIVFTQAFVTRRVSRSFSEPEVLKVSMIVCGAGVLTYFLAGTPGELYLVVPVFAVFNGLSQANLAGLMSRSVDASIQGEILGINSSIQAFAQSIPPILAGFLAARIRPSFPLLVSGSTIILAGVIFLIFYRKVQLPHAVNGPVTLKRIGEKEAVS